MRPAVQASVLRTSNTREKRRLYGKGPHTFSLRRMLMLVLIGAITFVPGVTLTAVGYKKDDDSMSPQQRIMYKAIGPVGCVLGSLLLFCSGVYYCCYATSKPRRHKRGQASASNSQSTCTYSSVRNKDNPKGQCHHHGNNSNGHPDGDIVQNSAWQCQCAEGQCACPVEVVIILEEAMDANEITENRDVDSSAPLALSETDRDNPTLLPSKESESTDHRDHDHQHDHHRNHQHDRHHGNHYERHSPR